MKHIFCAALTLLTSTIAWCAADIGWIDAINGNRNDVQILREGKKIDATQFLPIQENDRIEVVNTRTTVVLSFANGKTVNIDKGHTQIAKNSGQVPTVAGNLLGWIARLGKNEPSSQNKVLASSRGKGDSGKVSIPMLKNDNFLVAGDRVLALAWHGGKAPFTVKLIRRDNQAVIVTFTGVTDTKLVRQINIQPGIYELVVSDASGTGWREKLIAVANRTLPSSPLEFEDLPQDVRTALSTSWLASTDDGQWMLEAYTQIATQPNHSAADLMVLRALEEGITPKDN